MHLAWLDLIQGLDKYHNAESDIWYCKDVIHSSDFATCIWLRERERERERERVLLCQFKSISLLLLDLVFRCGCKITSNSLELGTCHSGNAMQCTVQILILGMLATAHMVRVQLVQTKDLVLIQRIARIRHLKRYAHGPHTNDDYYAWSQL